VKLTLEEAQGKVIVDGKISNPSVISRGVRQGDCLSATLFNPVLHKPLKKTPTKRYDFEQTDINLWICR